MKATSTLTNIKEVKEMIYSSSSSVYAVIIHGDREGQYVKVHCVDQAAAFRLLMEWDRAVVGVDFVDEDIIEDHYADESIS